MTQEEKTRIMLDKDSTFDGQFFVAVKTTGIVCLPSCPAKPMPKNVEFYDSLDDALSAGYRPCKRCKPDQYVKENHHE